MVIKVIIYYFTRTFNNNEQLVQKLSESAPVRRAAQLTVNAVLKIRKLVLSNKSLLKMLEDLDNKNRKK